MRYTFLKFVFTPLCQHTLQLDSASLFGACVSVSLFFDGRAAECAAATRHHRVEPFLLHGQLILCISPCFTVTKSWDRQLCPASYSHTQQADGTASSGSVSSPPLPCSTISSLVPVCPIRTDTGDVPFARKPIRTISGGFGIN